MSLMDRVRGREKSNVVVNQSFAPDPAGFDIEKLIDALGSDPYFVVDPGPRVERPRQQVLVGTPADVIGAGLATQEDVERELGDEAYDYHYGRKAYMPNYASVIGPHAFPGGGGVLRLPWLLEQEDIWVDAWGHIHDVRLLPRDYALNVLILIHEHLGKGTVSFDPFTAPLVQALRRRLLED